LTATDPDAKLFLTKTLKNLAVVSHLGTHTVGGTLLVKTHVAQSVSVYSNVFCESCFYLLIQYLIVLSLS
jgi:hypothetical protein